VIGLNKLSEFINRFRPNFKSSINCECYEDPHSDELLYDFAITSPPYYDTEEYSTEKTNSFNRYKTFDDWVDNFYLKMIMKTMDSLKDDGVFILNIGSRKYPLNSILIENFGSTYKIEKDSKQSLAGKSGLGKSGEGETFYIIYKGE